MTRHRAGSLLSAEPPRRPSRDTRPLSRVHCRPILTVPVEQYRFEHATGTTVANATLEYDRTELLLSVPCRSRSRHAREALSSLDSYCRRESRTDRNRISIRHLAIHRHPIFDYLRPTASRARGDQQAAPRHRRCCTVRRSRPGTDDPKPPVAVGSRTAVLPCFRPTARSCLATAVPVVDHSTTLPASAFEEVQIVISDRADGRFDRGDGRLRDRVYRRRVVSLRAVSVTRRGHDSRWCRRGRGVQPRDTQLEGVQPDRTRRYRPNSPAVLTVLPAEPRENRPPTNPRGRWIVEPVVPVGSCPKVRIGGIESRDTPTRLRLG